MIEELKLLFSAWTPGAYGAWATAIILAAIWWKGLPAVLDAWATSVGKEREHREREIKRLEDQITASDKRHASCMEDQAQLRREMNELGRSHAAEIADLQKVISGLIIQMRQMQLSAVTGAPMTTSIPDDLKGLLATIEGKGTKQ